MVLSLCSFHSLKWHRVLFGDKVSCAFFMRRFTPAHFFAPKPTPYCCNTNRKIVQAYACTIFHLRQTVSLFEIKRLDKPEKSW